MMEAHIVLDGRGQPQAVAFGGDIARTLSARHDSSPCADRGQDVIANGMAVRRLTPVECERLQGFPDNYTNIPKAADGPRYKALGNSMAVPIMRWIGNKINQMESKNGKKDASNTL
jgi:DNA (cytosine-5)-methyltransferase 1